ncbi:MAG: sulfotransferase [Chitinophagales bacterium]
MNTQARLPNFIVVGANKGGTTSLYHYLKQHPQVYLSPIKEPHYFSMDIDVAQFSKAFAHNKLQDISGYVRGDMQQEYHAAFVRNWEDYTLLYKKVQDEKAIGELSTSYLYSEVAAQEIYAALGKIRIIICLRNPIQRAFSHYRMNLWTGNNNIFDFYTALLEDYNHVPKVWGNAHLYTEIGMYYRQVKRYLDIFGRENVLIIFAEDLQKNSSKTVQELYSFIGVDAAFVPDTSKRYNEVYTPKFKNLTWFLNKSGIRPLVKRLSPSFIKKAVVKTLYKSKNDKGEMPDNAREFLLEKLSDDIQKLSELLGKDLSAWTK